MFTLLIACIYFFAGDLYFFIDFMMMNDGNFYSIVFLSGLGVYADYWTIYNLASFGINKLKGR